MKQQFNNSVFVQRMTHPYRIINEHFLFFLLKGALNNCLINKTMDKQHLTEVDLAKLRQAIGNPIHGEWMISENDLIFCSDQLTRSEVFFFIFCYLSTPIFGDESGFSVDCH